MTASVGAVAEIWRFPVKSMAGERVDTADLGPLGVPGDRHYAIRDVVSNKIVSAKQSKVGTALLNCRAWTTKDGVKLRVNGSSFLVDEGAGLDAALSMLLGRAVRLVSATTDREVYESYWPPIEGVALSDVTIDLPIGMQTQAGTFVDLAALHLASTGAVQELQRLCPGSTITMRRFRPSIVIDTGREVGFVENTWAGREAQLGGAVIRFGSASP